ncbi:MAG: hypothetical protein ACRDHL_12535 [Candidatus Promineifilaceae bacterium]
MSTNRRAAILRLAAAAYEMDLDVANGFLQRDEGGRWRVGERRLDAWLASHEGEELVVILGALADQREVETRTCHTCGRDYIDAECPYCRASRLRLRGRP